MGGDEIPYLKTKKDFDDALQEKPKVAIDFTATWCGPCKTIGPKFAALSKKYSDISFYKVDVDDNSDTSESQAISAMPTFKFYHNGESIDELVGASEDKLKVKLDQLNCR